MNFTEPVYASRLFGILLAVQFSTCAEPRLVRFYDYDTTPEIALKTCKEALTSLNYSIELYDPAGGIIITEPVKIKKDLRQFDYAVVVRVQDVTEIYLVVRKTIFKRSSDWSLGGKDLLETQTSDSMPYRIQKKIFNDIGALLEKEGFNRFDRKTRIGIANN